MDRESINILNWNACSIRNKTRELHDFLAEKEIDIAIITETHLKPEVNVFLPDYRLVRLDRTDAERGGVAVALQCNINCRLLPSLQLKLIEAVGVEVETPVGPITIIAAYCPKQANTNDGSAAALKEDIGKLTRRRGKFIIAGDLNAKHEAWGNTRRNRNGNILALQLEEGHFTILSPDAPTRLSRSGAHATIDIFLTNIDNNIGQPVTYNDLSSDHFPVVAEVGSTVNRHSISRRNYHRVNWERFQQCVDDHVDFEARLETPEDIDQQLRSIEEALSQAREQHVPVARQVSNTLTIDRLTKNMIRLRNTTRRQYQRTGLPALKTDVNRMTKIIHARMVDLRNNDFSNKIRSLPDCARPFWKMTKILKTKPRPIPPLIPLDNNGSADRLITPAEKADEIGRHFVSSHNLGADIVSPHEEAVNNHANTLHLTPNDFTEEEEITADELATYIKTSKNMKAPGFDNILNLELKHLSFQFYVHLALIFNQCLRLSHFPSQWKSAKVIPIRKPGKDPSSPKSYRPISLLSALSKLFEKAIYRRALAFTDEFNILLEEQFGFRRGRSTVNQLSRVTNILRRNKSVSKTSAMALLDVEKAFDNVWHDGLVYKLHRFGFPSYLVKIIKNYLSGRTFRVSLSGASANAQGISAGVPQGSILGPLLYNLFTSDMPPLPENGTLSLFADDTSVVYKGRAIRALAAKLQRGLEVLTEYLTSWKICINAAKTQVILFPHSNSPRLDPPEDRKITLNGTTVEWSKEAVLLGVTLDSKLIFFINATPCSDYCTR